MPITALDIEFVPADGHHAKYGMTPADYKDYQDEVRAVKKQLRRLPKGSSTTKITNAQFRAIIETLHDPSGHHLAYAQLVKNLQSAEADAAPFNMKGEGTSKYSVKGYTLSEAKDQIIAIAKATQKSRELMNVGRDKAIDRILKTFGEKLYYKDAVTVTNKLYKKLAVILHPDKYMNSNDKEAMCALAEALSIDPASELQGKTKLDETDENDIQAAYDILQSRFQQINSLQELLKSNVKAIEAFVKMNPATFKFQVDTAKREEVETLRRLEEDITTLEANIAYIDEKVKEFEGMQDDETLSLEEDQRIQDEEIAPLLRQQIADKKKLAEKKTELETHKPASSSADSKTGKANQETLDEKVAKFVAIILDHGTYSRAKGSVDFNVQAAEEMRSKATGLAAKLKLRRLAAQKK